jgi:ATP-dependent DNA helicase HFM1/MER3
MAQDRNVVFQHAVRVVKCMRDCYLHKGDAEGVLSAMTLERCLQAKSWHDSPTVLRQLRGVGVAYVRLLALKGIKTFESLRQMEPENLEIICNRSTPFGRDLMKDLERIPQYDLTLSKESQVAYLYFPWTDTYRLL